jgi:hypothetical protein
MNESGRFSFGLESPLMQPTESFSYNLDPQSNPALNKSVFGTGVAASNPNATPTWSQNLSGNRFILDRNNMSFSDNVFGGIDLQGNKIGGWGMGALNLGTSMFNGFLGYKNMKNAEAAVDFQKDAFSRQFENQRTLVNNELRDRDRARKDRDPSYQSTTQSV